MPAKSKATAKDNLYPRVVSTLGLKWDIAKMGKIVLFDDKGYCPAWVLCHRGALKI